MKHYQYLNYDLRNDDQSKKGGSAKTDVEKTYLSQSAKKKNKKVNF
jgi:hypothetical protein